MVLLNTVGTSLLNVWKDLGQSLDDTHRARLMTALRPLPLTDRRVGAELTSIHSLRDQEVIRPGDRLVFLVSDTPDGAFVGRVLVEVVQALGFVAESRTVHKLQGNDPKAFTQGLRNLVKAIATIYREAHDSGQPVAINATGGYKAQISFAGLIGQVFRVPVYYQFEAFQTAIELPSLPVDFAFEDWLAYRHVLEALDEGEAGEFLRADDPRLKSLPERLKILVDSSKCPPTLSALGLLYHEGFKLRFRAQAEQFLPKDSGLAPDAKPIRYEDGNHGKHRGLAEFLQRLRQAPYVTKIETQRYVPEKPAHGRFRPDPTSAGRLKGTYWDGTVAVEYWVFLSEDDRRKALAAAADLTERLR